MVAQWILNGSMDSIILGLESVVEIARILTRDFTGNTFKTYARDVAEQYYIAIGEHRDLRSALLRLEEIKHP